jgi:hypothetical protein
MVLTLFCGTGYDYPDGIGGDDFAEGDWGAV